MKGKTSASETGCLAGKTRILVTHSLTYLKHCDHVIVMENGRIIEQGSCQELIVNNGAFSELLEEIQEEELAKEKSSMEVKKMEPTALSSPSKILPEKPKMETQKPQYENLEFYLIYFRAIGLPIILLYMLARGIVSFLGVFSERNFAEMSSDPMTTLKTYTFIGICQVTFMFLASLLLASGTSRAARTFYSRLLGNILRSPMEFFDVTLFGSISTRFGNDICTIDWGLPYKISSVIDFLIDLVLAIGALMWTDPWIVLLFFAGASVCFEIMKYFISTYRQLRRLGADSSAPIYSCLQESIQGVSSIRAFKAGDRFISRFYALSDNNKKASYLDSTAILWLNVRMETIGNLIVLFVAVLAVYSEKPSGIIVFAIGNASRITNYLIYLVRLVSDMETEIISVERINEFSNTPIEGHPANVKVPSTWPEHGRIVFDNLQVRYRAGLDLVLHGLTFQIEPKERIGIVGRTGAGKSSITMALFRMIEADHGSIEIDGINIADLDLEVLRSRLTIVPQDPVCFSGSLRMNLDPFRDYNNSEIWKALRNVNLASFVETLPSGLDYPIIEGGNNLSVGQRQLICLARALLRNSRVLVLDEAAAAVDLETEALIQKTIREKFKDSTVLTIAHRLNTVMESDRILVLDKGHVAEFDTPKNLLKNPNGVFYSMAKDANNL